ncbi:hypothetical protein F4604DRAFT_1688612 [Suillus subluteus]|nr:hypothetical protein F4604DRAFT_1688612 [Suillus subluteus]
MASLGETSQINIEVDQTHGNRSEGIQSAGMPEVDRNSTRTQPMQSGQSGPKAWELSWRLSRCAGIGSACKAWECDGLRSGQPMMVWEMQPMTQPKVPAKFGKGRKVVKDVWKADVNPHALRHSATCIGDESDLLPSCLTGLASQEDNSTTIDSEEDNFSDVSIDDIWIGPKAAATDNGLKYSSSNEVGDEEAESSTSNETFIDLDPASHFNWFITTSHFGVGLFNEISVTQMLCAPGTSVHYWN